MRTSYHFMGLRVNFQNSIVHIISHRLKIISARNKKNTKFLDPCIERKELERQIFELIWVMRTSTYFMGLRVIFKKSNCTSYSSSLKDQLGQK